MGKLQRLTHVGVLLCRDVSFYGNKLFQSTFISIIAPGSSILTGLLWTLLNSFVALARASPAAVLVALHDTLLMYLLASVVNLLGYDNLSVVFI